MKKMLLVAAALGTIAMPPVPAAQASPPAAAQWSIGPLIRGRNYSVNMPQTLRQDRDGASFDFPEPSAADGHVHYVTLPTGSLQGARGITLRYRINAASDVRFIAQEYPQEPAILSLYFQRAGDRWSARTPLHRWYSPSSRVVPLAPGVHEVSISFDEPWIAMMGGDNDSLEAAFAAAVRDTGQVGFVFGSASGRGHGVYATGAARFTVLDFEIR